MKNYSVFTLILLTIAATTLANSESHALEISLLNKDVYLHTSYKNIEGYGLVSSNGLIVLEKGKAYIIDTPWSQKDTKKLVGWLTQKGYSIEGSLSTHSHEDRAGGIGFLNSKSIATYTSKLTDEILKERGKEQARYTFSDSGFSLGSGLVETFYPGAGHTTDNLVVWLPKSKILFGGCLVRSLENNNLGYLEEASLDTWENSIDNIVTKYPEAKYVVPGHGLRGGVNLLTHTKELAIVASNKSTQPTTKTSTD